MSQEITVQEHKDAMHRGWLLHDRLTCIPGTKTFWHDLIEWIPGLEDKTNNGELGDLPDFYSKQQDSCDYIIRNATYWPWIETGKPTISILQDIRSEPELRRMQIEVMDKSDIVVAVSNYVREKYAAEVNKEIRVIPIGVDYDLLNQHIFLLSMCYLILFYGLGMLTITRKDSTCLQKLYRRLDIISVSF